MTHALPGILGEVEEIAGRETAERLARRFGGTRIKIPHEPSADSRIAQAIGLEAARLISRHFGSGDITVPMAQYRGEGHRRATVAKLLRDGASIDEAASGGDVHRRTAQRIRARLSEGGDLPLFPDTEKDG